MYLVKKTYDNSPEFLRNEHYENITCTVLDTGVTADTEGKKFVLAGSLLDKDGKVVKVARSGSSGAYTYTFSTEPVGILFATTEVTYGQQAGALMIAGSVNTERLQGEYLVDAVDQMVEKMPFIKFFVDVRRPVHFTRGLGGIARKVLDTHSRLTIVSLTNHRLFRRLQKLHKKTRLLKALFYRICVNFITIAKQFIQPPGDSIHDIIKHRTPPEVLLPAFSLSASAPGR